MSPSRSVKLYLIDDDPAVLRSLCALLSAHGFNALPFESAEVFLESFDPNEPGCILLDIKMPGLSGLQLQEKLKQQRSTMPVIILTGHGDVPVAVQAMKNGAVDFIEKPVNVEELLGSIGVAVGRLGNKLVPPLPQEEIARRFASLTTREREVLDHLVLGKINKQIASDLGISQRTIEVHRARLQKKMKARNLADLIRLAG